MQIPNYYQFINHSKIISGKCALENIPSELAGYDAQKPLVIARSNLAGRGTVKKFIKAFYDSGVVLGGIFDAVRDYAGISLALDAAFLYKERGCDSIIALGSGPAADLAKAVNLLVSEKEDTLAAYYDGKPIERPLKPFIFVPACRSNGMEATNTMTIDNRTIISDFLYPDVTVIDPRMTPGCCPDCVAESGVTALEHAFSAFVDEDANPMTAAVALPALSYLSEYLLKAVRRPKNKNASVALNNASVMAAVAYSNSRPGMAKLLADELSKETGASAGTYILALLQAVIARMQEKGRGVNSDLLLALAGINAYAETPDSERGVKGLGIMAALARGLKGVLPDSLEPLKVQKYRLAGIAAAAAANSANRYSESECRAVLERAWSGSAS